MYREPSSAEATKTSPVKDPSAFARSAIRRQANVRRPSRYGGSAFRSATLRSPFPRPLVDEIDRESNGLPRHVHPPIQNPALGGDPFDLTSSLSDSSRREAGQRLLHDALRHSRPGQRLRIPRPSALPNLSSHSSSASDTNNRSDFQDPPHFTPRFAPAIAYHRALTPLGNPEIFRFSSLPRPEAPGDLSTIPLLRRVGQRSINEANLAGREVPVDGLGDRQRSVSLDDDQANDAWETLLTTITPDTNLPSADSSFTSASASGTNGSHSGTLRTSASSLEALQNSIQSNAAAVQMILDPYPEYPNPCDYPSSTDSETESETEITQDSLFRRYRRRMRQVESMRRSHNLQSALHNHAPIPAISFAFSDSSTDQDLHQMQAILDRLARREDIPDDWWAAAGLSRIIGQRASANDDSNSTDGPLRRR
ncbi:hypothetical protein P175DRAFT_0505120 [Aspergillus ochraceoroseus IBT 24754]|uniref:Uncharacterized protein n=2 Tax=Aspergillus ochraceoroseus TaxID=138278 RepID=A0A2T5LM48_9EURO|nr:uncharacterized protein P175DRAFT_0505120 [Aspergillus ochraceoroseus IBT 24754]KKK13906.1 hypothetical protein AOCH_003688 [Aspergillus ochraceoroseus]PTU17356.1 hypothetical protein P175DRAFT_0505120 [Aspergillus ochraceoroseus IBT 24754]